MSWGSGRWVGDGDGFGEGDGLGKGHGFRKGGEGRAREERGREGKGRKAEDKICLRLCECAQTDTRTDRQTDRHTEVKTVHPPVSLRSLGGYKKTLNYTIHSSTKHVQAPSMRIK